MEGQKIVGTVCDCGKTLPPLVDDNGWGILVCKCGKWYDTQNAMKHKGRLYDPR